MDMRSFAVSIGVEEDRFVGVNLDGLSDYDDTKPVVANLVALYRWAKGRSETIAFESAYQIVGMIEDAKEEEVDLETILYVFDGAEASRWICDAYLTVANGYLDGEYVAVDFKKAREYIAEAQTNLERIA